VTINVPSRQGVLLQSGRDVIIADINITWWSAQIQSLETQADPAHLAVYLTDNVMLYTGHNVLNCCVIGYHGTRAAGNGAGNTNSNGNANTQTFAWASWIQPRFLARPNGGTDWATQDIHPLSHEISEWADVCVREQLSRAMADGDRARVRANPVSEPTQTASANIRRYTLRGDLNPFHGFRQPSTGCN
jgi:hypothetical protein